jgi:hypothetical protein
MAAGDFVVFDQFLENLGENVIPTLSTTPIHMGIVTNATVPAKTTADPRWGAGGTTNFLTNEVTPGGNYATGGPDLTVTVSDPWTRSGSTVTFDLDDVSITQNGSNPSGAYWGIIYVNDANDYCIGYVELGGPIDLSAGDFTITWHASGLFTLANP